jgi:hypothetical protein
MCGIVGFAGGEPIAPRAAGGGRERLAASASGPSVGRADRRLLDSADLPRFAADSPARYGRPWEAVGQMNCSEGILFYPLASRLGRLQALVLALLQR